MIQNPVDFGSGNGLLPWGTLSLLKPVSMYHQSGAVTFSSRQFHHNCRSYHPDSKVHGANMGPSWGLSAPDGPQVDPMDHAIRAVTKIRLYEIPSKCLEVQRVNAPEVALPYFSLIVLAGMWTQVIYMLIFARFASLALGECHYSLPMPMKLLWKIWIIWC